MRRLPSGPFSHKARLPVRPFMADRGKRTVSETEMLRQRIADLEVKLAVLEGVIVEVIAPIVGALPMTDMVELINAMRTDLRVTSPNERSKLVGEEHINQLADKIERKIRNRP